MRVPNSLSRASTAERSRAIAHFIRLTLSTVAMLAGCSAADASLGVPAEPSMAKAPGGATLSLVVSPASVVGGTSAQGTVTIANPAPTKGTTISLASSVPTVASVPASVTVPRGQTSATFAISTTPGAIATVTITATQGRTTKSATLGIVAPDLVEVSFPPLTVVEGSREWGVVTLSGPASSDTFVSIVSGDPASASVTGSGTTVLQGATSATFEVQGISAAPSVTITATLGATTRTTQVAVVQP